MEKLSQPTSTQNNALSVVISTRNTENVSLKHLMERFAHPKTEFLIYENNNQYSLSELYNKGLSESKNDIVVFMHDDIIIETPSITRKIIKLFQNNPEYGIIGLAGTDTLVAGIVTGKQIGRAHV